MRSDACVSIYLETTPLSQQTDAARIELGNLVKEAGRQLAEAGIAKASIEAVREPLEALDLDDEFWRFQATSLALLATADQLLTFRLANRLPSQVEVSDRFHLKPLLRAITFPHAAFVLALSAGAARLVEVPPSGPAVEVKVQDLPKDAADAAGQSTINDRSPKRRIQGSEGQKIRLTQYARKVEAALRPVLAGGRVPLFLAATEPLLSIYRSVNSYPDLAPTAIVGGPDRSADAELAAAARAGLDRLYADNVAELRTLFLSRAQQHRTTIDVAQAARAATFGAIEALLVDFEAEVPGTVDDTSGAVTFAAAPGRDSYGVVDEIAARALTTGARVMAVRKADIPERADLAAILRYPF
jgi:hypothetical protein